MSLQADLEALKTKALQKIEAVEDKQALDSIRVHILGKKGTVTEILRGMKKLEPQERPKVGAFANETKQVIANAIEKQQDQLEQKALQQRLTNETIDVTLPGREIKTGVLHVLNQMIQEIEDLFVGMGYQVVDGPEVETDHYNFEMMNIPKNHPARDMQDTFYITNELLLRTHTSPDQARTLEKHDFSKGPLKMISPGRVYRRDTDDATHSHQFNQIEGLVIDRHVTMADLKGTLGVMLRQIFGEDRQIRLRPSYFPFTEPSIEVDISCFACGGKGCAVCKYTGWIEVLGGGMVHPNVLEKAGVDSNVYGGFAFGIGPDRFAMLKYGIKDIREFYQNDLRFLHQFAREVN